MIVRADVAVLTRAYLGHASLSEALRLGSVELVGPRPVHGIAEVAGGRASAPPGRLARRPGSVAA